MRILIYGINYAPELTGIGKYTGEMASWLAAQGHDVAAVTALPYYPEWEVAPHYKGKKWFIEKLAGVKVYRTPIYIPKDVSSAKRILHELSFQVSLLPHYLKLLFGKKYDVIFCIAPPFHLGYLPLLQAKLKGSKYVYHIQDLQVDAAKDLGMINNKSFLKLMFACERFLLKRSHKVSTISRGMTNKILAKGIGKEKLMFFPNWVDTDLIHPLPVSESLRERFGLQASDKVVLYSGNLGEKQGLDLIIQVAHRLKERHELQFVICGSGGAKDNLIALRDEYGLTNVSFFPLQPYEELSNLLATADVHLVLQKASASDLVMPSKLTSILAAGGFPLVTAMPGTSLYEVITEYELGVVVAPESVTALQEGLEKALSEDLGVYRKNARAYSEQYLSKDGILKNLESDLMSLVNKPEKVLLRD